MNTEQIAQICHEVNRAYCESIGDFSQKAWKDTSQWQIDSAINGVNFHRLNPNAKPNDSHENWLKEKEKDGWKWGSVKNVEKKEHPCFLPYSELPQEQRSKDYIFSAIVKTITEM